MPEARVLSLNRLDILEKRWLCQQRNWAVPQIISDLNLFSSAAVQTLGNC